eukprot:767937-Hanusia_phi.AAC.2
MSVGGMQVPIRGTNQVKGAAFHPMPGYKRRGEVNRVNGRVCRYAGYVQGITSENKFGGTIGKLAENEGDMSADDSLNKSGPQVTFVVGLGIRMMMVRGRGEEKSFSSELSPAMQELSQLRCNGQGNLRHRCEKGGEEEDFEIGKEEGEGKGSGKSLCLALTCFEELQLLPQCVEECMAK